MSGGSGLWDTLLEPRSGHWFWITTSLKRDYPLCSALCPSMLDYNHEEKFQDGGFMTQCVQMCDATYGLYSAYLTLCMLNQLLLRQFVVINIFLIMCNRAFWSHFRKLQNTAWSNILHFILCCSSSNGIWQWHLTLIGAIYRIPDERTRPVSQHWPSLLSVPNDHKHMFLSPYWASAG